MKTTVRNLRNEAMRPGDIRIDRRTEFGNEFIIGRDGSRADVIAKFEKAERARLVDPSAAGEARCRKVRAMHGKRLFARPSRATEWSTPNSPPSWSIRTDSDGAATPWPPHRPISRERLQSGR
jgi:hypothetical protein